MDMTTQFQVSLLQTSFVREYTVQESEKMPANVSPHDAVAGAGALAAHQDESTYTLQHPWATPFGNEQHGSTREAIPFRLSSGELAWQWSSPEGRFSTVFAGGPVIDGSGNFYVVNHEGVHKLCPHGQELWFHQLEYINNMVSLYEQNVLGSAQGTAFCLSMEDGSVIWETKLAEDCGGDSGYPAAHDGIFVVGAEEGHHPPNDGGNTKVFGLNSTTGEKLWQFDPEVPVWNFAPLFPGDDSTVFMDFAGNIYKLHLKSGELIWKTLARDDQDSFSDGGAILGSTYVYTCSNVGAGHGQEGTQGALRAYSLSGGELVWEQILSQPCNSYPAVGKLGQRSELSVVVTPGAFIGTLSIHGSVMAFDALTGDRQWQYQTPVWHGVMAKNDMTGIPCIPAHWSAPIITVDGIITAVRIDGLLYEVYDTLQGKRDPLDPAAPTEIDFQTTPGVKVETFDADRSALHGAIAFAPGTMAFCTCDTLYVFKH